MSVSCALKLNYPLLNLLLSNKISKAIKMDATPCQIHVALRQPVEYLVEILTPNVFF